MTSTTQTSSDGRLMCLDALRGFDMFWIVGGDVLIRSLVKIHDGPITRELYEQMDHVPWEGFHFYDLIFPLFVFMTGVSIVYSIPTMIERRGKTAAIKRIVIRSAILFALGIFYMGGVANGFKGVYLAGVLHRIAVAYFFAALLFCFFRRNALVLISFALLAGYWALLRFIPAPGIGHPSFEQGKNLAYYIDQRFLPGQKFEGTILSTMAAVANCLLGIFAGLFLKTETVNNRRKPMILIIAGMICLLLGFAWGEFFPIIKLLWTSSYVLVACGCSAVLLGIFYQVIEIWKARTWARPFVWIGMNPLAIYIISGLVGFQKLAARMAGGDIKHFLDTYVYGSGDFVLALVAVAMMLSVARYLHQRGIFLRL